MDEGAVLEDGLSRAWGPRAAMRSPELGGRFEGPGGRSHELTVEEESAPFSREEGEW